MSRYNSIGVKLKGWVFLFFVAPSIVTAYAIAYILYDDEEEAFHKVSSLFLCPFTGHNWADETEYGVQPVCLECGTKRESEQ
jgi:hypothetical protein